MPMPRGVQDPGLRPLRLLSRHLGPPTMEAWKRILHVYALRHPLHQVRMFYHHQPVPDLMELARHAPQLDHRGFEVQFRAPDGEEQELPRLMAMLAEAAGPRGGHYLTDADPGVWFAPAANAQAV